MRVFLEWYESIARVATGVVREWYERATRAVREGVVQEQYERDTRVVYTRVVRSGRRFLGECLERGRRVVGE